MSFWLTKVFADNTRRVFSFFVGNKGQLENADWTIGLLSRFLTLRLHYSIASLHRLRRCFRSRHIQSRDSILACRCQFVSSLTPLIRLLASFQPSLLTLSPLPPPDHQNASLGCRGGETLDSQIIESNSGGQFLSVARRLDRSPSPSPFVPSGI